MNCMSCAPTNWTGTQVTYEMRRLGRRHAQPTLGWEGVDENACLPLSHAHKVEVLKHSQESAASNQQECTARGGQYKLQCCSLGEDLQRNR